MYHTHEAVNKSVFTRVVSRKMIALDCFIWIIIRNSHFITGL